MLERQEGQQQSGDKPLPEAQQVDHKAHLLSQWAAPNVNLLRKIEKQTANPHNMLTAGASWWNTDPAPEEGGARQRNKPPVNKHNKKPPLKQDN
jgi:hypothetical protein